MSFLHALLRTGPAWSTHHRITLDALRLLRCDSGWQRLFLRHSERLLAGVMTPEDDFGDYKNHVLCVRDGNWGGAPAAARAWYLRTVYALRDQLWSEAAFSAGVLAHYVVDPLMPLHAGQSEAAGAVHFGIDYAIDCGYARLRRLLISKLGGHPDVETANSKDWLERLIRHGAEQAYAHYDFLIDHCEPNLLLHRPKDGMDDEARNVAAKSIGLATATFARVLERAIEESGAAVPSVRLFGFALMKTLGAPFTWLTGPLARFGKRAALHRMVREYQQTGKVVKCLTRAEREVRQQHAVEVRRITMEQLDSEVTRAAGSKHPRNIAARAATLPKPESVATTATPKADPPRSESAKFERPIVKTPMPEPVRVERPAKPEAPAVKPEKLESLLAPPPAPKINVPLPAQPAAKPIAPAPSIPAPKPPDPEPPVPKVRYAVSMSSAVADAPGITPQLAGQLVELGVENVGDLLTIDPKVVVDELKSPNITADKVIDWQAAAALACQLPEIRGNDLLLLVSAGVHDPRQLSRFAPQELLDRLQPFLKATDRPDMIRLDPPPALRDVSQWIELAKKARPLSAAA